MVREILPVRAMALPNLQTRWRDYTFLLVESSLPSVGLSTADPLGLSPAPCNHLNRPLPVRGLFRICRSSLRTSRVAL